MSRLSLTAWNEARRKWYDRMEQDPATGLHRFVTADPPTPIDAEMPECPQCTSPLRAPQGEQEMLTSFPPQARVQCAVCGWKGTRVW